MTKLTLERHEFITLKEMIDERLNTLEKYLVKQYDNLDEYERDITNYTTYDLHVKLMEVSN